MVLPVDAPLSEQLLQTVAEKTASRGMEWPTTRLTTCFSIMTVTAWPVMRMATLMMVMAVMMLSEDENGNGGGDG